MTIIDMFSKVKAQGPLEDLLKRAEVSSCEVKTSERTVNIILTTFDYINSNLLNEYTDNIKKTYSYKNFTVTVVQRVNTKPSSTAKVKPKTIIGGKITGRCVPIEGIDERSGRVVIEGEIVRLNISAGKRGNSIISFDVYDGTSSIMVKHLGFDKDVDKVKAALKTGIGIKLKGEVSYDMFARELCIKPSDAEVFKLEKDTRSDNAEQKRVELHAHTKMSAMDGFIETAELIKRAHSWGHKAVAITDHGVCQSFPDAYNAATRCGMKVIFGVEAYLIDDRKSMMVKLRDVMREGNGKYVVFDIETTGLAASVGMMTEIGAVKIENGVVTDEFSSLIDPLVPIPERITKITGITSSMVAGQPQIEEILPHFLEFCKDCTIVAHNVDFDMSFIKFNAKKQKLPCYFTTLDTVELSRSLFPDLKNHKLNTVAKALNISLINHHRASDDAHATAQIFLRCMEIIKDSPDKYNQPSLNNYYHAILLAKNKTGIRNMYKLVSDSHIKTFHKKPLILKSELDAHREGLILGSACERGELYRAIINDASEYEIEAIARFYDYLEIQPIANNHFLVREGLAEDNSHLQKINKYIVDMGERLSIPVVATCDAHFLNPEDEVFRRVLFGGQDYKDADEQAPLFFRTTEEMLEEFEYLGAETAKKVVITNTNLIADMVEALKPTATGLYPPRMDGVNEDLVKLCNDRAHTIYGNPLPQIVRARMDIEIDCIVKNNFSVMYMISQSIVKKSNDDGYLVGSRGSVGSSFAAFLLGITEVNALCPHYVCPSCRYSEFYGEDGVILETSEDSGSQVNNTQKYRKNDLVLNKNGTINNGIDLPDMHCPKCNAKMKKDGHNIPFETFLDVSGKKIPDIDLNFSGEYQANAHKFIEDMFGKDYVYRAGTIGTIAEKTAYGFARKYFEDRGNSEKPAEIRRTAAGSVGVKRTTGQHPGGMVVLPNHMQIYDFCPIQYAADDKTNGVVTTHFDYHAIEDNLLKFDILGHDDPTMLRMLYDITGINPTEIPLDDAGVMSLFRSTEALGVTPKDIGSEVGTFGIPEFGTKFVRQMLVDTKPETFYELILISGLSHGTDVWLNNAYDLVVRDKLIPLSEAICLRDDIMLYLNKMGLDPNISFSIMESVRKGKGLTPEFEAHMRDKNVPDWYIISCKRISYMFPKAHAAAYVTMALRIAYYKVHHPLAYYCAYFSVRADDFDTESMANDIKRVISYMKSIENRMKNRESAAKDEKVYTILEICLEMYKRGFRFCNVDIYKSHPTRFQILDGKILPSLNSFSGLSDAMAESIAAERDKGEFLSMEDLRKRCGITKSVIEVLERNRVLTGLSETNQLSFF